MSDETQPPETIDCPVWGNRFNNAEFQIMPLRTSLVLRVAEIVTTIRQKKER